MLLIRHFLLLTLVWVTIRGCHHGGPAYCEANSNSKRYIKIMIWLASSMSSSLCSKGCRLGYSIATYSKHTVTCSAAVWLVA